MKLLALAITSLILSAAPAAGGTLLTLSDGTPAGGSWQSWVNSANVPTPPGTVTVDCSNPAGLTRKAYVYPGSRTVYVPQPAALRRRDLLHELGHVFDYTELTDDDRAAIMHYVLHRTGPWRSGQTDSPHEQFAVAYELAASNPRLVFDVPAGHGRYLGHYVGDYGVDLSPERLELLRTWLRNIYYLHHR